MARMVPFPMLPTDSAAERRLYEGFLKQLDDQYVVYHSVDWVLAGRDGPIQGEADFVIVHPEDGLVAGKRLVDVPYCDGDVLDPCDH